MNNKITTYEELMNRKKDLEELLKAQGELIQYEFHEMKRDLKPIQNTVNNISDFVTRDNKAWLLNEAVGVLVDKLIKDLLLSNSGWITKNLIPVLLKNYSSHYMANLQENLANMLNEWISHFGEVSDNGENAPLNGEKKSEMKPANLN